MTSCFGHLELLSEFSFFFRESKWMNKRYKKMQNQMECDLSNVIWWHRFNLVLCPFGISSIEWVAIIPSTIYFWINVSTAKCRKKKEKEREKTLQKNDHKNHEWIWHFWSSFYVFFLFFFFSHKKIEKTRLIPIEIGDIVHNVYAFESIDGQAIQ